MVKNLPGRQETCVQSLGQEDPMEKEWLLTPVLLPGEFHGQRTWQGCKELDMTGRLTSNTSLLKNNRKGIPWWSSG